MSNVKIDLDADLDVDVDVEQFKARQEEVRIELNDMSTYANDILANSTSINSGLKELNSKLGGLKTIKTSNDLDNYDLALGKTDELMEFLKIDAAKTEICMLFVLSKLLNINMDENVKTAFMRFLEGAQGAVDAGTFWILNSILSEVGGAAGALSFLLVYGTDATNDNGNFIVGDLATWLSKVGGLKSPTIKFLPQGWANMAVGTAVVLAYNFYQNYTDAKKGGITDDDKKRIFWGTAVPTGSYLAWSYLAGMIGGPGGVAVASLVVWPISKIFNRIGEMHAGDIEYDYFYKDGVKYTVYQNGTGKYGDFGYLAEEYSKKYRNYMMYANLEEVILSDNDYNLEKRFIDRKDLEKFMEVLDRVQHADSMETGLEIYENYLDTLDTPSERNMIRMITQEYGFNASEYYDYANSTNTERKSTIIPKYETTEIKTLLSQIDVPDSDKQLFWDMIQGIKNSTSWSEASGCYDNYLAKSNTIVTATMEKIGQFNWEEYFDYVHTPQYNPDKEKMDAVWDMYNQGKNPLSGLDAVTSAHNNQGTQPATESQETPPTTGNQGTFSTTGIGKNDGFNMWRQNKHGTGNTTGQSGNGGR